MIGVNVALKYEDSFDRARVIGVADKSRATFEGMPGHIGECERRGDDWSGLAVHVGARIGAMAGPKVLASRTVRDLSAGFGLDFEGVGVHQLKGLAEEVALYRVRAQLAR